jgi:hypothetical protein
MYNIFNLIEGFFFLISHKLYPYRSVLLSQYVSLSPFIMFI